MASTSTAGPAALALLFLALPLLGLLLRAPWGRLWEILTSPTSLDALRLSLVTATSATVLAFLVGVPLAWLLARAEFPGRRLARSLVTVPLELLGWTPKAGETVKMGLGYLFGNAGGSQVALRAYWMNNSFSANVTNDVPNESRLEPAEWGSALVE